MSNEVVIPPCSWADASTPELTPEQVQMIASGLRRITDPNVTRRLAVQLQDAHERILANIKRHRDLEAQLRRERDEARGWIAVSERLPVKSGDEFFLAKLTDSHMQLARSRRHDLEISSGWYINAMPQLYTHWQPLPAPPTAAQPAQEQP